MTLQETLATIAKSGLPLQGKLDALKFEFDNNLAPPRQSKYCTVPPTN